MNELTPEQRKAFAKKVGSVVNEERKKLSDNENDRLTTEQKLKLAQEIIDNSMYKMLDVSKSAVHELFVIDNPTLKIGHIIRDSKAIKTVIKEKLASSCVVKGTLYKPAFLNELCDLWLMYSDITDVQTYGGFNRDQLCLGRSTFIPAPNVNFNGFPTWEQWLSGMTDPEAFSAWIYGVASKEYTGRQVLWLHGPNGEDGKTFIQKRIAKWIFPNVTHSTSNVGLNGEAGRWTGSAFEGKQLAIWDDCNNRMAMFTESVKMLSAGIDGNLARVERKGRDEYSAQLETRLWINSNYEPDLSKDNFITSRIVYVKIGQLDSIGNKNDLDKRFFDEMPNFLGYAKLCYRDRCKDDRHITQNDESINQIKNLSNDFDDDKETIFEKYLALSENGFVYRSDLYDRIKDFTKGNNHKTKEFYNWLQKEKPVTATRKYCNNNKQAKRGFTGIRLTDRTCD